MSHLLHIDSSVRGEVSVSRRLTARGADRWRAAHPDGMVTYRDLGASPVPHLDAATGLARMVTAQQRTPAQDASFVLSVELIDEIKQADTVLLGLPLYNFGPPSTVKPGSTTSSPWGCPSTPRPTPACSAAPTSSCLPAAAVVMVRARRVKVGIMRRPGCHTPCR